MMTKIFSSEDEMMTSCRKWRELLGLSHWHTAIHISRAKDMPLLSSQGTNRISIETEQALITLIDPQDYPLSPFEQDMEVSLVHELLHISVKYFANPESGTIEHSLMEAFIERTAKLLVALERKLGGINDVQKSTT